MCTYVALNAFYHASLNFVGQNVGAKKFYNVKKVVGCSVATVVVIGVVLQALALTFSRQLIGLYAEGEEAIHQGVVKMFMVMSLYVRALVRMIFTPRYTSATTMRTIATRIWVTLLLNGKSTDSSAISGRIITTYRDIDLCTDIARRDTIHSLSIPERDPIRRGSVSATLIDSMMAQTAVKLLLSLIFPLHIPARLSCAV